MVLGLLSLFLHSKISQNASIYRSIKILFRMGKSKRRTRYLLGETISHGVDSYHLQLLCSKLYFFLMELLLERPLLG